MFFKLNEPNTKAISPTIVLSHRHLHSHRPLFSTSQVCPVPWNNSHWRVQRRGNPSVSSQLVKYSIRKDSAKSGRWDASFRLLATPPTVRKACKSVDFEWVHIIPQFLFQNASSSNEQKQAKRPIHVPPFNTVHLTCICYNNWTRVVVVVPLIHVTITRSDGFPQH